MRKSLLLLTLTLLAIFYLQPAAAQDSVVPADVEGLELAISVDDLSLSWTPVTLDAEGQAETVDYYNVYRGSGPHFPIEFDFIGSSPTEAYLDEGAAADGMDYHYLITAVDDSDNEGGARPSGFTEAPVLSGYWTATTIEIDWDEAAPLNDVDFYRVYHGPSRRSYDSFEDVGLATVHSLTGLVTNRNYYIAVVAVDASGNQSPLSNEHFDALAGTIDLRAHNESRLCFGGCPPQEGEIQRNSGREIMVPVDFPEGDWTNIELIFTADSRLCTRDESPFKCGGPPWNPCGDPWDRTASVYLVLDSCIEDVTNCYAKRGNLELIRTITPFGTDADPPEGSGVIGPAVWTYDITPYASLLTGTKYVGAFIGAWVSPGWYVTVDFHFSEAEVSPKPPAAGVAQVWFRDGGNSSTPTTVTIPAEATEVVARWFITGHGGVLDENCACLAEGRPCDEFCSKPIGFFVDSAMKTRITPYRDDCSPLGENVCGPGTCQDWNACGCPSCTYNRSGWCPGLIACHHNEPCDQDLPVTSWFTPGTPQDIYLHVFNMTPGASWANSLSLYWY
jgi:hypothetical protein